MTAAQIQKTISTGRLYLGPWGMLKHYHTSILLLIVSLVVFILGMSGENDDTPTYMAIIFLITGVITFGSQWQRLQCRFLPLELPDPKKREIVEAAIKQIRWGTIASYNTVIITRHSGMHIYEEEIITVIFTNGGILINSRPDVGKRGAQGAIGRNKANVILLINTIQELKKSNHFKK